MFPCYNLNFVAFRNFSPDYSKCTQENVKAKGGMPWISSSKAVRRRCAATSNSSPPWILSLRRRYIVPPLSISCSPVTISILERSENFGQILANVFQENLKRKYSVSPEFPRPKSQSKVPFASADFPRFVADFSVTLYSRVFFTPYESTRDVKPRPKSTMKVPFDCRFSSIVADFSVTLYSRVFFTPYESTRDVKPRPKSTMNVPFDCRFSSIVADFSVTLYSRVFFTPYESTRDVKPRPKSTMKVPFDCRFSSIVADFSVLPV